MKHWMTNDPIEWLRVQDFMGEHPPCPGCGEKMGNVRRNDLNTGAREYYYECRDCPDPDEEFDQELLDRFTYTYEDGYFSFQVKEYAPSRAMWYMTFSTAGMVVGAVNTWWAVLGLFIPLSLFVLLEETIT